MYNYVSLCININNNNNNNNSNNINNHNKGTLQRMPPQTTDGADDCRIRRVVPLLGPGKIDFIWL